MLRQQLNVLRRSAPKRPALTVVGSPYFSMALPARALVLDAMTVVRPDDDCALASRRLSHLLALEVSITSWSDPRCLSEVRRLIREMSLANPSLGCSPHPWRAPQARHRSWPNSVAKYMARRRRPPSQGWRTFLFEPRRRDRLNRPIRGSDDLISTLYGLLVLGHDRRQILWLDVTAHPTAEWVARQVTEAYGWESAPEYLVRDRDGVYGEAFTRAFGRWAFATDQQRRDRPGRTAMPNG